MPFIPHTDADVKAMLKSIGVNSIDDLFDEIPEKLRAGKLTQVPEGLSEMDIGRLMQTRANQDGAYINFIGAGAYEHHIPAAVWEIVSRGEFYSAYTPYQAEASQGTLQLLYEYQTMMASLTGMDVSNASLYDGASGLAEAVLMAVRAHTRTPGTGKKTARKILMPSTVHPIYHRVVHAIVANQNIELVEIPHCTEGGHTIPESLRQYEGGEFAALVIPQPNFFGVLEEVDALTDWAHAHNMLAIGLVNPTALALLTPPGQWGAKGADIAVGEGQPLGAPLSSGGPYYGFMCCKEALVRQMPGRIIGRTVDKDGKPGFTLTLQAREQHIRRSKATSNICTNQGLVVAASTIYMALLGPDGLERVAQACHANTLALVDRLTAIKGVTRVFNRPVFHEAVLRLEVPVSETLRALEAQGILGGYDLAEHYPHLGQALLVCATETRTQEDIEQYAFHLERIVSKRRLDPPCAVKTNPNA
ncbi:MAG: glycine dehydrogenase (aminomethyl-transferring) [Candidatus Muproteobacteria bacterium RIFCSPHIGHO2_12_FULL_60_33]|uniref:Probable glycine dehydrogenase (decarboxylating) subunit 1 n=1 Tax=Candidatus Muproteobacteria bacterium RIFCSPLOWO2_01_FULL_60_18 TaxID=1817768 RepID=A0A1F6TWQ7_9PROT|nr:MAG: glycine dehydrogenase (aminomethyl-transferring) [Candidatus Muproteobacteria bacterium RIFCSPLOWO2_01_FULL_60_18]OGI55650.1 MAG: glycine dehydrogenase (aminomethyl-transferring) [Candidatus Muproteobacteria bacterium RIFCSPHIGHO2_12_FULL_60_33]